MRCVPKYNLVPGPTSVSPSVLQAFVENFASSDIEDDFWDDYEGLQTALQTILKTQNEVIIMSGEGMVVLWGAMKSVIKPGDKVVSVVNGLYGEGFAQMAEGLGATVERVDFPWIGAVDNDKVIEVIQQQKPQLVTMVHCETPTGCLNSLAGIGDATTKCDGLFLVDFVSSAGGVELNVDEERIDLGLLGSQKVLGAPPALAFASVSNRAWKVIANTNYSGYDAFLPFQGMKQGQLLPYTHNWHAIVATRRTCQDLIDEGMDKVQNRHAQARDLCIDVGTKQLGLKLYNPVCPSPTVTAFCVPEGVTWDDFNDSLRTKGVIVSGSYGDLVGKIFRIGHMGRQASPDLVKDAMEKVAETLVELQV